MITMKNWVLSAPAADQEIGFEGESLIYTLTVQVDAGPEWVYRIELAYSNGRKDILLPEYENGKLSTVLRWSTLCAPGTVAMQIRATQGDKIRLSTVTTLYIKDSVRAVPVFHSGLPTEFEQLEQDLYAARDAAQAAAEQVLDSIGGATESASKAASDASRAESARAGAELAAEGATAAKEAAAAARDAIVGMTVEAETLETGQPATAAGSLADGVYKLALGLPRGAKGEKGDTGDPGPKGETGATGATGPAGPANMLSIGTVSSGDTAAATITGTAPEQVLNLVLPKGDKGNPGSPGSKGDTGDDGNGIASIALKSGTHAAGTTDTYTITMTDGTTFDFSVYNGADGQGAGDMLKSVYDPGNKAQDVFQYVDDAVANVDVPGKLDKPANDATATAGQLLTKTADGQEWQDPEKGVFIATLGNGQNGLVSDKTFAEIQAAYDAGKVCFLLVEGSLFPLLCVEDAKAIFSRFIYTGTNDMFTVTVKNGNSATIAAVSYQKRIQASGLLKGDVNGVSSATAGADYVAPDGDSSNLTAAFTTATTRANVVTGEKLSVLFGKIAKWFADLDSLAFKSTVAKTDLASDVQTSLGKADTALQSAPVTSVNGKTGAVTVAVPTVPTTTNLLKGDGSGGMSAATAGTDYTTPANVRTILNRTNNVNVANTSYTTYMARGEALFSAETTPTANGCIAWQYE